MEQFKPKNESEINLDNNLEKEPEIKDFEAVKKDLLTTIDLITKEIGFEISESDHPTIKSSSEYRFPLDTSAYSPLENVIYIHEGDYGDINVYGEEVLHWIRAIASKEEPPSFDGVGKIAVDEFFGRLGESLIRDIAQERGLDGLLKRESRKNIELYSGVDFIKYVEKEKEDLEKIFGELKDFIEKFRAEKKSFSSKMKEMYSIIEGVIEQLEKDDFEINAENIDFIYNEIINKPGGLLDYGKSLQVLSGSKFDGILGNYKILKKNTFDPVVDSLEYLSDIKKMVIYDGSYNRDEVEEIKYYFEIILQAFDLSFADPRNEILTYSLGEKLSIFEQKIGHILGYVSAEFYVKNNKSWRSEFPEILRYSGEEVIDKCIGSEDFMEWYENNTVNNFIEMRDKIGELIDLTIEE